MDMDWISTFATVIAVLRLCLICGGMWMVLRFAAKPGVILDYQRKCFISAGIVYLLGLIPQSLLLLLVNSDLINFMLDNGYLCWTQNFACMIAAALHSVIFLTWITDCIHPQTPYSMASMVKRQSFKILIVLYVVVFMLFRGFFLWRIDSEGFYTDVASKIDDVETSHWTMTQVKNPSWVIRLQFLLCESSLSEEETSSFLLSSYAFLLMPLVLLYTMLKSWMQRKMLLSVVPINPEEDVVKGKDQPVWWEHEVNIQRLLSTSITFWFHVIQPIIFYFHREHFVDFGTHLLFTICVFIPWTPSDNNSLQRWV
ncbi:uncharacterized protein CDAR_114071 [Caerostris darwini]|uniref:G-protein coupled receptors family 1 profile domain-containing protein n=1 Tax=Caerostris darwini TaxID=1538125 RepID=A0AAV4RXF2_9ARAC|nr:uncharacterized protein CDAR_114071 [Caerostris darwini]